MGAAKEYNEIIVIQKCYCQLFLERFGFRTLQQTVHPTKIFALTTYIAEYLKARLAKIVSLGKLLSCVPDLSKVISYDIYHQHPKTRAIQCGLDSDCCMEHTITTGTYMNINKI